MHAYDCDVVAENGLIEDSLSLVSLMRQSGVAVSRRVTSDIVRGMALGSPTRPRDPSLALGFLMGLATSKTAALDADVYNSMIDVLVKVHADQCCKFVFDVSVRELTEKELCLRDCSLP